MQTKHIIGGTLFFLGLLAINFQEDISKYFMINKFENKLKEDFTLSDLKIDFKNNIIFEGYSNEECSQKLETTSTDVSFNNKNILESYKEVAFYYQNKLYVANYIKKYTSKDLLDRYILSCIDEIKNKNALKKQNENSFKVQ